MVSNITTIRVRYADTDKMQFVYNGKYLEYFEVGRTELLREKGLPYSVLEGQGYSLPVVEAKIKYKNAARYDDLLDIESTVSELFSPRVHVDYVIRNQNTGNIVAEGYTSHIFMKNDTFKAVRPPKVYLDTLKPYFE
jgi:acyl-CoA thioester hydrolase